MSFDEKLNEFHKKFNMMESISIARTALGFAGTYMSAHGNSKINLDQKDLNEMVALSRIFTDQSSKMSVEDIQIIILTSIRHLKTLREGLIEALEENPNLEKKE